MLRVRPLSDGPSITLELRVFEDGVAFRHVIATEADASVPRVPDEATTFVLPAGATVWFHDLEGHYESVHRTSPVEDVAAGEWAAPPMTFRLPNGGGYGAVTEAALTNSSGMALRTAGERKFEVVLGHAHPPSYPFRLRYEEDVERLKTPASFAGTITSPWRVVLAAGDLNELVNSDVIHNVCPPPDAALFPRGMNEPWIRPGRAVWKYLDGGDNSLEEVLNFNRLAGALGFEYQVVEGFWRRWSEDEVRRAVADARSHGVGLWFWRHSRELRTPEARREFFRQLRDWGVVGAKIDFFDHEHKEVVDLYAALLEEAARHRIMVNFHGANKPTGEARTWPNELTREGVKGMEARRLAERARHDATLPFTRYLAGPGDYTPVVFGERRGDTTAAHQIATAAAFDEPLLTFGAHPQKLLDHPAVEIIKSIPPTWDETIVLPASEIGEVATFARRRGRDWFVVVVNGPTARTLEVPCSFLGAGSYQGRVVHDAGGDPTQVEVDNVTLQREDVLEIDVSAGGGYVARLTPSSTP
jgi:alpha-glucosidase